MDAIFEAMKWANDHGVPGILSLLCLGEGWIIYKLWKANDFKNECRVDDMKAMIDVQDRLHDKTYKGLNDMARVAEFIERQKRGG
jgi:hypothetical protein